MAQDKASVLWESEQVVSGQEKAGLPPLGKGLEKECGLRGWAKCQDREAPAFQELKDKRETPMKGDRKAILFIRSTRIQNGAGQFLQKPCPKKPR